METESAGGWSCSGLGRGGQAPACCWSAHTRIPSALGGSDSVGQSWPWTSVLLKKHPKWFWGFTAVKSSNSRHGSKSHVLCHPEALYLSVRKGLSRWWVHMSGRPRVSVTVWVAIEVSSHRAVLAEQPVVWGCNPAEHHHLPSSSSRSPSWDNLLLRLPVVRALSMESVVEGTSSSAHCRMHNWPFAPWRSFPHQSRTSRPTPVRLFCFQATWWSWRNRSQTWRGSWRHWRSR